MTDTGEVLRTQRPFVLFWLARVFAMLAHQMLAVGVGWQVYALTGSALDLGLVGLAQFVPAFFLVLVAGHVADHFDPRRVLQACMLVEALAALPVGANVYLMSREFGVLSGAVASSIVLTTALAALTTPLTLALIGNPAP